jgi:hypothetical protein
VACHASSLAHKCFVGYMAWRARSGCGESGINLQPHMHNDFGHVGLENPA